MREYRYPSPVIAERIKSVFIQNKLTIGYVAGILDTNRKTIMSYTNAVTNPSIKFIRWLCSNYNVNVAWLLDLE